MTHPRHLLLLAALLAACGSDSSPDAAGRAAADSADSSRATVQRGPADAPPAADSGATTITLAPDGLDVAGGGSPRRLAFGTAQARLVAEVGRVLGEPREQALQPECPAGPLYQVSYADGLQLVFQDSAFVGWFAGEGSRLRTAPGIGPGATLGQLRSAYPGVTVEETSLGHEFAAGELYGIVADTSSAGAVQVVFAGINCIFR